MGNTGAFIEISIFLEHFEVKKILPKKSALPHKLYMYGYSVKNFKKIAGVVLKL